jgi:uncharacterized membrane protein YgcG
MWASFGSLSVVPWILFAQMSWSMDAVPVITAPQPSHEATAEVQDRAGVFGRGAARQAREELDRVHRRHRAPVLVESIKSLDGARIADVAQRRARMARAEQLYVLVIESERDVGVIAARHGPSSRLTDQQREIIRRAFLWPLQAGDTDAALEQGVRAIGTTLAAAASRPRAATQNILIFISINLAVLAVLLTPEAWVWYVDRRRRRRKTVAGTVSLGNVPDPFTANPTLWRVPRATSANDLGDPCRTASSSARSRYQVEA